jgi:hypothetical protein
LPSPGRLVGGSIDLLMRRVIPYVIAVLMAVASQVTVSGVGLYGPAMYGVYAGFCAVALLAIAAIVLVTTWPPRGHVTHSA